MSFVHSEPYRPEWTPYTGSTGIRHIMQKPLGRIQAGLVQLDLWTPPSDGYVHLMHVISAPNAHAPDMSLLVTLVAARFGYWAILVLVILEILFTQQNTKGARPCLRKLCNVGLQSMTVCLKHFKPEMWLFFGAGNL